MNRVKLRSGWLHWGLAAGLIVLGVYLGKLLEKQETWIELRYRLYRAQQQRFSLGRDPMRPKRTTLVLIGDEEFWAGEELAHRSPIKRGYLAALLRALDRSDPAVIALDFDLRSRFVDGSRPESRDYRCETRDFVAAVKEVSARRAVVLPRTLGRDERGYYRAENAIYDGTDYQGGKARTGYIVLPRDMRQVPVARRLGDGTLVDSFAGATARAADPNVPAASGSEALPYGTFIGPRQLHPVFARQVLGAGTDGLEELRHRIVLVGAAWSEWAYHRGPRVDSYSSPIGFVPGVYLHANYVEALLDSGRLYNPLSEGKATAIEVFFAALVAVLLSLEIDRRVAWWAWWKLGILVVLFFLMLGIAYVSWQNLGLFFDFFIPMVLLAVHAMVEQVLDWRHEAHQHA